MLGSTSYFPMQLRFLILEPKDRINKLIEPQNPTRGSELAKWLIPFIVVAKCVLCKGNHYKNKGNELYSPFLGLHEMA